LYLPSNLLPAETFASVSSASPVRMLVSLSSATPQSPYSPLRR
jgi:hypothetical protein